jgi:hypothetical protein
MKAVIFCGPSLRIEDRAGFPEFRFLPPVAQGDVYRASLEKPLAIGIIDGYFEGIPAVWHKEILWAMKERIAVFGAASMGALRAAELHAFGMRGVGSIFEAYRDGDLADDDEVALVHGPAELGYPALSEPMVNIRAALEQAAAEGILSDESRTRLVARAKAQFYQERSFDAIVRWTAESAGSADADRFAGWLAGNRVDCKRQDATAMLGEVATFLARGERPGPASFSFEWTESWANAAWRTGRPVHAPEEEPVLDELRLLGAEYQDIRRKALLAWLARQELAAEGVIPQRSQLARTETEFRMENGLARARDVDRWAAENGIAPATFKQLMSDQVSVDILARQLDRTLWPLILDQLRLDGRYPALKERARRKSETGKRLQRGSNAGGSLSALLLEWYFDRHLQVGIPDDLGEYALSIGLSDIESLMRLILAEHRLVDTEDEPSTLVETEKKR